ncbi:MAG: hypothetical protein MJ094_08210 [Saccharofermentans sp.]|nr:hypothetical protein [Saccharofermentans sp.]
MALWDESATGTKCSNCGGNIFFDESFQKMSCKSCGSFFDPYSLELAYQLKVADKEKASEDDSRVEYSCDSCGATVITDDTTVATVCAFCGSPAIAKRRLVNEFRPDYIIPFKISKEDAKNRFKTWAKQYTKAPKNFSSDGSISKMQGVYIPFWLVDAECTIDYTEQYFDTTRRDLTLSKVPFDGAKAVPDKLMRAIEPYDYDDLVPYNDGYLHGFKAKRYDYSLVDMTEQVQNRINSYLEDIYKERTEGSGFNYRNENNSYISNISQTYALLPVWFFNYEYDGQKYQYVINGQTGEVQGFDVPYSKRYYGAEFSKRIFSVLLASIITLPMLGLLLWGAFKLLDFNRYTSIPTDIAMGTTFILLPGFIVVALIFYGVWKKLVFNNVQRVFKKPVYHVIDEEPEVYQYIDPSSIKKQ